MTQLNSMSQANRISKFIEFQIVPQFVDHICKKIKEKKIRKRIDCIIVALMSSVREKKSGPLGNKSCCDELSNPNFTAVF